MILVLDIGNSSISIGLFNDEELLNVSKFDYSKTLPVNAYVQVFEQLFKDINFSECVLASVSDETTPIVCDAIAQVYNVKPVIITHDMNLGIKIKAKNPEHIGIDRIANAYEASKLYSSPIIVVDCGTATTFDIIDSQTNFIGGIIMPGIGTQLKSLSDNTSKLKQVNLNELERVQNTINTDTNKAILSGIVRGHAYAIDGLLNDCIKELKKKPKIIATGGYAETVNKFIKKNKFTEIDADLTLKGFWDIYNLNRD